MYLFFTFTLICSSEPETTRFTSLSSHTIRPKKNLFTNMNTIPHYVKIMNILYKNLIEPHEGGAFLINDPSLNLQLSHVTFYNCMASQCGAGYFQGKDAFLTQICGSNCRAGSCQFLYITNSDAIYTTQLNESSVFRCCPNETRVCNFGGIYGSYGSQLLSNVNMTQNGMHGGPTCFFFQSNHILVQFSTIISCYGEMHGFVYPSDEVNNNKTAEYNHINLCNNTYYKYQSNSMLHAQLIDLLIQDSMFKANNWRYFFRYKCIISLRGCVFDRNEEGITCSGLDTGDAQFGVENFATYDFHHYSIELCEVVDIPEPPSTSFFENLVQTMQNIFKSI
ncbi:hypothetical protein TRFO_06706 [Tritrichomonas foetus]|uniref:Uncharacterized protein n=1 Tax=Tritrichomonas foetus TaxID=1144522 RepID=A0A1J4JYB2_9EUKA|nr:hypothetical protein TRFO_06706 [Tritrichomonas foetus]|eukprot:OHT03456.1 hypothetical protein TRFO_06706 [Tritrichomonas foetus]